MFFAVVFGVAITLAGKERTATLVGTMEGIYAASTKIIDLIMMVAPYAVACLLFNNIAQFGLDLLHGLERIFAIALLPSGVDWYSILY